MAPPRRQLGRLSVCPIINGLWQTSPRHGPGQIDPTAAVAEMFQYYEAGFNTFDGADHYGPAEDLMGEFRTRFRERYGEDRLGEIVCMTKWVPQPSPMTRSVVEAAVKKSLDRMRTDCIDVMQFHWWDYGDSRYMDALRHLADLQSEGVIRHLALTNFDAEHVDKICEAGIPIVSNQVQFSLVDRRPLGPMSRVCERHGVKLMAYGCLAGGLLTDRFLGAPEPGRAQLNSWSLGKYKRFVDAAGGWQTFQDLLRACDEVAKKHSVKIANVAVRWALDQPNVAGACVGARLSVSKHVEENARTFSLELDEADRARLTGAAGRLLPIAGDCGDEYRG
eukprot:tig00000215_g18594.t1